MLFQLEQGPHAEAIIRQSILNKQPVPDKIAKAPVLLPWLDGVFTAFTRLTTCRQDLSYIPWSAVHQYAVAYGYAEDIDEMERFETLIHKMDSAYIGFHQKKNEREMKAKKKPVKKGRSR